MATVKVGGVVITPAEKEDFKTEMGLTDTADVSSMIGASNTTLLSTINPVLNDLTGGQAALDIAVPLQDPNTVNLMSFIPEGEHAAIYAGSSTYDAGPAIMAAINSRLRVDAPRAVGANVILPNARLWVATTLQIKCKCSLIGGDSGLATDNPVTELVFAPGVAGIVLHRYNTIDGGLEAVPTTGSDGTILRGFTVTGPGYASASTIVPAIRARARFFAEGVTVRNWRGDAWDVRATMRTGGGDVQGNANLFQMNRCAASRVWGNGLFVSGDDVNAGNVIGFNALDNGLWGIYDNSFLGNAYTGCHTNSNGCRGKCFNNGSRWYLVDGSTAGGTTEPGTNEAVWRSMGTGTVHPLFPQWVSGMVFTSGGAIKTDNANARTVFTGCYTENTQPPSSAIHPTVFIGGLHDAKFTAESTSMFIEGTRFSPMSIRSDVGSLTPFRMRLGERPGDSYTVVATGDNASGLSLASFDQSSGDWVVRHSRLDARTPVRYTTNLSTFTGGRSSAVGGGQVLLSQGPWIGGTVSTSRRVTTGTAVPTTGEWVRGDEIRNISANADGDFAYWRCTTTGTGGATAVFKGYGRLGEGTAPTGQLLSFGEPQTLTAPQQLQGCTNLGVGDPEFNYVTGINAALSGTGL